MYITNLVPRADAHRHPRPSHEEAPSTSPKDSVSLGQGLPATPSFLRINSLNPMSGSSEQRPEGDYLTPEEQQA